jgi:hypothetical protein
MEACFDIPDSLVDNGAEFASPLFADRALRPAKDPLVVDGKARGYLFPTLYADVRCAVAILHCRRDAVRALVQESLGPGAEPPRLLGGRTVIAISCYEYRRVRGVRPYNEIAVAVPVNLAGKPGLPVLGAFAAGPDSGYWIAAMPVTSEENRRRGHHFWNLPKTTRGIDIAEADGNCRFTSRDEDGGPDISLEVPMRGKTRRLSVRSFLAVRKDGTVQRCPTAFEGNFEIGLDAATLLGVSRRPPALTLGRGAVSDLLRSLGTETTPLQTRYAASMDSYFDLPAGAHEGE